MNKELSFLDDYDKAMFEILQIVSEQGFKKVICKKEENKFSIKILTTDNQKFEYFWSS